VWALLGTRCEEGVQVEMLPDREGDAELPMKPKRDIEGIAIITNARLNKCEIVLYTLGY